jgi:hypothetical protein
MYFIQAVDGVTVAFSEPMISYIPYIASANSMAMQAAQPLPRIDVGSAALKNIHRFLDIVCTHNIKIFQPSLNLPVVNYKSATFDLPYPALLTNFLRDLSSPELWDMFHAACFMNMDVSGFPIAATVLWRLLRRDTVIVEKLSIYGSYYERLLAYTYENTVE